MEFYKNVWGFYLGGCFRHLDNCPNCVVETVWERRYYFRLNLREYVTKKSNCWEIFGELLKYLHESLGSEILLLLFNINILQVLKSVVKKVGGHLSPPLVTIQTHGS